MRITGTHFNYLSHLSMQAMAIRERDYYGKHFRPGLRGETDP